MTASLLKRGGATLGPTIEQPRCGRAPPRLHPGITQEVAPNENQRAQRRRREKLQFTGPHLDKSTGPFSRRLRLLR